MAVVVKRKTRLRRQARLAWVCVLGGLFFICLLDAAAVWMVWHHLVAGWSLLVLVFVLLAVAPPVLDRSLIPIRGYLGEKRVCAELTQLPDEYRILNDVQVKACGKTAQIDHVLVSPYGMWCIETKSHFGWIYGQAWDRTWTQVKKSERGRTHKKQVANWASDNEWQRSQLDEYLRQRLDLWCPVKCLVVLTGGRMMKDVQNVVNWRHVRSAVRRVDTQTRLSQEQIRRILDVLPRDKT